MKNMKKFIVFVSTVTMLAGCGSPAANESGTTAGEGSITASEGSTTAPVQIDDNEGAVVTLALPGGWDSLCPLASTSNNADTAANTIFENLFEADGKGGYIGRLGESYEVTDDNKALVVHLRQNAVWHDGEPFDADDVMFSVGLVTDGSYTTSRRLFFQQVEGCTESGVEESADSAHVEKIDDYTVKFYYRSPLSDLAMLSPVSSFFIMPEHILKDADPATILENDFWVDPIGTGPFTFESTVPGESLTVAAFNDYYLGRPKFGKLVVKVISSANLTTSMMSKEVDLITGSLAAISDSDYELATTIDGYNTKSIEANSNHYLVLNNETFKSPKIRKALAMMMDKEAFIKAGCNGNGSLLYSMYPRLNMWYDQGVVDELGYQFDPDTAYQMLVEEGFDFDRTYVVCINDLPVRQAMMTIMQETWAKYGMKLEIQTLDTQTCISTIRDGGCDFWINGGNNGNISDLSLTFIDWCTVNSDGSYAPFNLAKISDPALMNLFQELSSALTVEEQQRITSDVQRLLLTDYNYIYTISPFINTAISSRLTGVDEDQMLVMTLNYCDWEVVE